MSTLRELAARQKRGSFLREIAEAIADSFDEFDRRLAALESAVAHDAALQNKVALMVREGGDLRRIMDDDMTIPAFLPARQA